MSVDTAFKLAEFAKRRPTMATLVVLAGLVAWNTWAHQYGHAKAADLQELEQDIINLKTDVGQIKDDLATARREALENQMFEARIKQCLADNDEVKRLHAARLDRLMSKYREAGGTTYALPSCDDL